MFDLNAIILAIALAADATAVAVAWSLSHAGDWRSGRALPWAFGIAQAGMTAIGYAAGAATIGGLTEVCKWVAVVALSALGLKMMWPKREEAPEVGLDHASESVSAVTSLPNAIEPECVPADMKLLRARRATFAVVVTLAVATSLDALAAGVGLPGFTDSPWWAIAWIGVVSLILPAIGLVLGIKLGARFGCWGERIGGAVLVGLAIKTALF